MEGWQGTLIIAGAVALAIILVRAFRRQSVSLPNGSALVHSPLAWIGLGVMVGVVGLVVFAPPLREGAAEHPIRATFIFVALILAIAIRLAFKDHSNEEYKRGAKWVSGFLTIAALVTLIFSFSAVERWTSGEPSGDTVVPAHGVAYIYPEGYRCVGHEPVYGEDRKYLTITSLGEDPQGRLAVIYKSSADYDIPLVVNRHNTLVHGACENSIVGSHKWSRET